MAAEPFGALLRRLRTDAVLSQNRLARQAGCDPGYVNRLERGADATPSRKLILALCAVLDASEDNRERLLVAAGHCPEAILRAGGWDGYRAQLRRACDTAVLAIEAALRGDGDRDDISDFMRRAV